MSETYRVQGRVIACAFMPGAAWVELRNEIVKDGKLYIVNHGDLDPRTFVGHRDGDEITFTNSMQMVDWINKCPSGSHLEFDLEIYKDSAWLNPVKSGILYVRADDGGSSNPSTGSQRPKSPGEPG